MIANTEAAEKNRIDEAVEGGKFIVGGRTVNANNEPLSASREMIAEAENARDAATYGATPPAATVDNPIQQQPKQTDAKQTAPTKQTEVAKQATAIKRK